MKRIITITMFALLLQANPPANAGKLEKVSPQLEYFYNLYFDPGYLDHYYDSLSKVGVKQMPGDSARACSPDDLTLRPFQVELAGLHFIDAIPHVRTMMFYDGNTTTLQALGVTVFSHFGNIVTVRFPLRVLPQLASLPGLNQILGGPGADIEVDSYNALYSVKPHNFDYSKLGALELCVTVPVSDLRVQLRVLPVYKGTAVQHTSTVYPYFTDTGLGEATIDRLPSAVYHLILNPADSVLERYSICNVSVFPDSCTRVELDIREKASENQQDIEFLEWKRNDSNVTVIDSCRGRSEGSSKEKLKGFER